MLALAALEYPVSVSMDIFGMPISEMVDHGLIALEQNDDLYIKMPYIFLYSLSKRGMNTRSSSSHCLSFYPFSSSNLLPIIIITFTI